MLQIFEQITFKYGINWVYSKRISTNKINTENDLQRLNKHTIIRKLVEHYWLTDVSSIGKVAYLPKYYVDSG